MAWALQFDGVNDYMEFPDFSESGDFSLSGFFKLNQSSSVSVILGSGVNNNNFIAQQSGIFDVRIGGSSLSTTLAVLANVDYEWSVVRVGSSIDITLNGITQNKSSSATAFFNRIGRVNAGLYIDGEITSVLSISSATDNRSYNVDASSHAAGTPILTDTVGGNNATGVNMPTDGSAWVDLGGDGVTVTVTEILNSFVDASNVNVDYNVSLLVTESFKQFTDSSIVSIESAESVTLSVTESFNKFIDSSSVNTSKQVSLAVTEILKSFEDGANISIAKDVSVQVTEIMASFTDNSSVRLPANWNNKPVAVTSYTVKTPTTTIWIDKG